MSLRDRDDMQMLSDNQDSAASIHKPTVKNLLAVDTIKDRRCCL
jgi:hypothetical protein